MTNTSFTLDRKTSAQEVHVRELIKDLLIVLSEKEKHIIESRFALEGGARQTLEEIGGHFGVTRERVRQIEKSALRKLERSAQNSNLKILTEFAKALLEKEEHILSDVAFKNLLLKILPNISQEEIQDLHLALNLEKDITFNPNTLRNFPYWYTAQFDVKNVIRVQDAAIKALSRGKSVLPIEKLSLKINEILKSNFSAHTIENILHTAREIRFTETGVGLNGWRHINPRTLRDKIEFILSRDKKPMHFERLTALIKSAQFDQKRVNVQAVHNELIRNENFILIGRGIYALKEWGYKSGTVSEVIAEILSDGIPRSREEITQEVLKQRHVKTITIYLNLKNSKVFSRVGRDKYSLTKLSA